MQHELRLEILAQPDDTTCGPTCLQAVYRYFGLELPLEDVIAETAELKDGGTLAVFLGIHALLRGWRATIYTYNLEVFDPTWFRRPIAEESSWHEGGVSESIVEKLDRQIESKHSPKLLLACTAYRKYLLLGGELRMRDLNDELILKYLRREVPILTGLSSTYLYQEPREIPQGSIPDDIVGVPSGHFVVLHGYDPQSQLVQVADPYERNPLGPNHHYQVTLDRLVCSILLGVLTYDANLLILQPPLESADSSLSQ